MQTMPISIEPVTVLYVHKGLLRVILGPVQCSPHPECGEGSVGGGLAADGMSAGNAGS